MAEKRSYERTELELIELSPEDIIERHWDDEIRKRLCLVIEKEAPIMEDLLFKRVLNSLSLKKLGSRLLPVFEEIAGSLPYSRTPDRNGYVYHNGKAEDFFRPSPDASDRYSYQIPSDEAAVCLEHILSGESKTVTKSMLLQLFKKEMGYERAGSQVESLFEAAVKSGRIERTGNGRFKPI